MKKNYQKVLTNYLIALFVLGAFLAGLFIGRLNSPQQVSGDGVSGLYTDQLSGQDFSLFWNVWDIVDDKFILKPVDQTKLLHGAIDGMIKSLDDPYSAYMDPDETKKFKEQLEGNFEGIGAELTSEDGLLKIVSVLNGTPAESAGIEDGDVIVKIDGEETFDITVYDAVAKIRGEKGTEVVLSVAREGNEEVIDIPVTRDTINVPSIASDVLETESGKKVLKLDVLTFAQRTSEELESEIQNRGDNFDAVILDLRGNTGGLLSQGVKVASRFLEKDSLVAIESFSNGDEKEFKTTRDPVFADVPVVVLVNNSSASASEILAGALRDLKQIKLVGVTTFGKGTVQEYLDLSEGGSLRISVAKWLTPNRVDINKQGLAPDIEVEDNPDTEEDEQLNAALEELN